jgi:hypothetical protein
LNAPEIQVRVNVSLRVRAGTPAHPGSHAGGDARAPRRRSVCRLRKQAGTPAHPGSRAGGDAHPLRRRSVCRLRMRAGTPSAKTAVFVSPSPSPHAGGDTRAPRLACRRGRPPTQATLSLPSPHAGGDTRAPRRRSVCRLRMEAGTPAHPGSQAGGDARAPRLASGRGRPRTQDAYGSIILHIALNAQSP